MFAVSGDEVEDDVRTHHGVRSMTRIDAGPDECGER